MFERWTIKTNNEDGFCVWNGKRLLPAKDEAELWKQLRTRVTEDEYNKALQQLRQSGEAVLEVHVPGQFRQGRPGD